MKKDAYTLWEQEGDLERMKLFFQEIRPDAEQKERIKRLALEKIREEELKASREESPRNIPIPELSPKESFRHKAVRVIKSFWWRWQWKLAVPVVALLMVAFIGIGMEGMNSSSKRAGQGAMNQAAIYGSSSDAAAPEMASAPDFNTNQSLKAERDTLYSIKAGTTTQDQVSIKFSEAETPPAEEGLEKKITYTFNATLQVENVSQALSQVSQAIAEMGGYVVESSESHYQGSSSAYATFKIPAHNLEGFRGSLEQFGKVLNSSTGSVDITNDYYDYQARLKTLTAQEERYLEILQEAKTVEDILNIESYLSSTRMQIEQLQGQLKLWDHQVAYSTVTIHFQTTPNVVAVNDPWQPVSWANTWQAVKDAVLKTISSTWNGLNYLVVGIAYASPYLLLVLVVFAGYKIIKRRKRK